MAPPVSNFLIGQLYSTKGIDLNSTADVRKLKAEAKSVFGKDLKTALIDIIKEYIDN